MSRLRAHVLCLSVGECTENGKFPMAKGKSRVSKIPAAKNSVRVKSRAGHPMVMLTLWICDHMSATVGWTLRVWKYGTPACDVPTW